MSKKIQVVGTVRELLNDPSFRDLTRLFMTNPICVRKEREIPEKRADQEIFSAMLDFAVKFS